MCASRACQSLGIAKRGCCLAAVPLLRHPMTDHAQCRAVWGGVVRLAACCLTISVLNVIFGAQEHGAGDLAWGNDSTPESANSGDRKLIIVCMSHAI